MPEKPSPRHRAGEISENETDFASTVPTEVETSGTMLDFGCGSGRALLFLRKSGFKSAIGVDVSPAAIQLCKQRGLVEGRDVFLVGDGKLKYDNRSFDTVFSEGVLEHYSDPLPLVTEMCRLAGKFVIIVQPNHFSLYGLLLRRFKPVHEYSYRISDFTAWFGKNNFKLAYTRSYNFGEGWVLLFGRSEE